MTYYVAHPNLSLTALVHAPATEKARTTFLDYLERRNMISRADRQYWRKNMVAERMEDPYDINADVELYYGYEEGGQGVPTYGSRRPTMEEVFREQPMQELEPTDVQEYDEGLGMGEPEEGPQQPAPRNLSPIAKASLRGYVQ